MSTKKKPVSAPATLAPAPLLGDLRGLILAAREQAARSVNTALTLLYWRMGDRIRRETLGGKRADYGEEILQTLSAKLTVEFGRGYSPRNLWHDLFGLLRCESSQAPFRAPQHSRPASDGGRRKVVSALRNRAAFLFPQLVAPAR